MLNAHIARFDVMGTVALFGKTFRELNKGLLRTKLKRPMFWNIRSQYSKCTHNGMYLWISD